MQAHVLEAHPIHPHIAMSAGYDGSTILWDLLSGSVMKRFESADTFPAVHGRWKDTLQVRLVITQVLGLSSSVGFFTRGFGFSGKYAWTVEGHAIPAGEIRSTCPESGFHRSAPLIQLFLHKAGVCMAVCVVGGRRESAGQVRPTTCP